MKVPYKFDPNKVFGWSVCIACSNWKKNLTFFHESRWWTLCLYCALDYWDATDELLDDYRAPVQISKIKGV